MNELPKSCNMDRIKDDPTLLNLEAMQKCKYDLSRLKEKTQSIPHSITESLGTIKPLSSEKTSPTTEELFKSVDTSSVSPKSNYIDENGSVWTDETIVQNSPKKPLTTGQLFASTEKGLF